jgi:DNA-binding LytR/AlgR family response regulator
MIRIAICDDQPLLVDRLVEQINLYSKTEETECIIQTFNSGLSLLTSTEPYDLLFLDIEMPVLDGLAVAKRLRTAGSKALIVFVTSHDELVYESFNVKAFRYLVKPTQQIKLNETISAAIKEIQHNKPQCMLFEISTKTQVQVPIEEILYIITESRETFVQTQKNRFNTIMSMQNLEEALTPYHFFRSHSGCLVNLKQIRSISTQEIIMLNEDKVYLSRLKTSKVKKAFMNALKG